MGSEGFKLGREVIFHFCVYGGMHFLLMVVILALSFRTSFWVSVKSEDKVLKWASRSWLWVWAMMKGGKRRGWVGPHKKWVMGEGYHDDQGEEGNPMG
jgi:hypothetical protein